MVSSGAVGRGTTNGKRKQFCLSRPTCAIFPYYFAPFNTTGDMNNTDTATCYAMPASFNKITQPSYT